VKGSVRSVAVEAEAEGGQDEISTEEMIEMLTHLHRDDEVRTGMSAAAVGGN
jgi:hypothetical protein